MVSMSYCEYFTVHSGGIYWCPLPNVHAPWSATGGRAIPYRLKYSGLSIGTF